MFVESVVFYVYFLFFFILVIFLYYILVFDKVIINVGNVYYIYMGIFIVLRLGFYVFIWIIRLWGYWYYNIEFFVDNNIVYIIFFNFVNVVDGSVIGIVVVYVDEGDDVFVRIGLWFNVGDIGNDFNGWLLFVGWILM